MVFFTAVPGQSEKEIVFLMRLIHLTSKDASVSGESLALTTTSAFLRMFEVLWLEFKLKDGRPVCL